MKKRKIEIVIPVYNEENELADNIQKLYKFCEKNMRQYDWRITIADNASEDNTAGIAATLAKKMSHLSYLHLDQKGRGRAVKTAWGKAKSDYYVYMDLDLSTDLVHLPKIIAALEKGYDIAIGSRLLPKSRVEGRTLVREITSRTLNYVFIRMFFRTRFSDAQCGFKAVTKKIVDNIVPKVKDNDWFFDGELLIIADKSGYKIYEEAIHWVDNPGSTVRLLSTIKGNIITMARLLKTRPWEK